MTRQIRYLTMPAAMADRLWLGATTLGLWPTIQLPDWCAMRVVPGDVTD